MSDDLVARLRGGTQSPFADRLLAADEIERLRSRDQAWERRILQQARVNGVDRTRAKQAEARLVDTMQKYTGCIHALRQAEADAKQAENRELLMLQRCEQAEAKLARVTTYLEQRDLVGVTAEVLAGVVLALLAGEPLEGGE